MTLALSGYMIVQIPHNTVIQSLSIFPLVCIFVLLLVRKNSWIYSGLLAFTIGEQILIGFPQTVFITLLFATAYVVWLLKSVEERVGITVKYIVACILGFGISAIQLLPSREFLSTVANGTGFSLPDATFYSYPLAHLKTLLDPFLLGNPKYGTYPTYIQFSGSLFWENTAYIGIIPLILMAAALVIAKAKKTKKNVFSVSSDVLFYVAMTAIAFLLMTGSHSPLYLVYSFWPFNIFRVPSRFIWVFIVGLVLLSVAAFDYIKTTVKGNRMISAMLICIIGIHIFQIIVIWRGYHAIEPAGTWISKPTLANLVPPHNRIYTIGAEQAHDNIFFTKGWIDMKPYIILQNMLTPDRSALWNIANVDEKVGRFLKRSLIVDDYLSTTITESTHEATVSATGEKLLNIIAISDLISALPLTQSGLTQNAMLSYKNGAITLYTNPNAPARIYLATRPVLASTAEDALGAITAVSFIPGSSVIVERPIKLRGSGNVGILRISKWQDEDIVIHVNKNTRSSILVYADSYFPGWIATIDGKQTQIIPVNINQKGVIVSQGDHIIHLYYAPGSLKQGAIISAISILLTVIVMAFAHFLPE